VNESDRTVGLEAGDGLAASASLIDDLIAPALRLHPGREDGFWLPARDGNQVVTSDVFSVDPLIFPGGNIGALAAIGVCNDLLASGARPTEVALGIYASADLRLDVLRQCLESFSSVLEAHGAEVVCGDTKVHPDKQPELLLFATAIGSAYSDRRFDLADTRPGDVIIVTGPLGDHTIAVLSLREGLGFESVVTSDAQPLMRPLTAIIQRQLAHSFRDLTRGGLIAALWDGFKANGLCWSVDEDLIPVRRPVRAAAEMLGLDVLALTNEGCMLITTEEKNQEEVIALLRSHPETSNATVIGRVEEEPKAHGPILRTRQGVSQLIPSLRGIGVPRLC